MVNEVDNRPRYCHPARRTLKFFLDTTTLLTPGQVVGGSPPSILKLSRRGETTINKIISGGDVEYSALVRRMLNLNQLHPRPEPSAADPADKVTVITPVFGQRLHQHPADNGIHIIVVDDGSAPPVHDATIRLDRNCGPAAARNVALTSITTEFVAFVDADIDVGLDNTWLTTLLAHFDDPEVVAVAPRVRSRPQRGVIGYHERHKGALDLGAQPAVVQPGTRVSYVPAAALICRAEALRAIGGFDEDLRTGEDVDLVWRLHDAGWTVRYDPSIEVQHEPRASFREWWNQRVGYGYSSAALAERHGGERLSPLVTSPWSLAVIVAMAATKRPSVGVTVGLGLIGAASQQLRQRAPDLTDREARRIVIRGTQATAIALGRAIRRVWWPLLILLCPISRGARRLFAASAVFAVEPMVVVDDIAHGVGIWSGVIKHRRFGPVIPVLRRSRPQPASSTP